MYCPTITMTQTPDGPSGTRQVHGAWLVSQIPHARLLSPPETDWSRGFTRTHGKDMKLILLALVLTRLTAQATAAEPKPLFDGKTFDGWDGDTAKTWTIEDGAIVGGSLDTTVPRNEFLCTKATYGDFELKAKFKLIGDKAKANAGIQFRTKRIPNHHEVSGYQADVGQAYWGALYDESRRNKVLAQPDPKRLTEIVKYDDWNEYTIRCEGPRIRLWLNGTLTVDFTETDEKIERSGIIGLQIHGGAKARAFYKDIQIEELKSNQNP